MHKNIIPFLFLLLWCRTLVADNQVLVKGLASNRAILSVNGQLLVLKKGQKKQGIELLDANESRAVVKTAGKTLYLFLDKSIAKHYSRPEKTEHKELNQLLYQQSQYIKYNESRIVALRLVKEKHDALELELEYYYDGKYGSTADFVVSVINKGRLMPEIKKQYFGLEKGQNKITLHLDMRDSDKMVFYSEAINIAFLARTDKTKVFYTKTIKFEKYWKKVAVR